MARAFCSVGGGVGSRLQHAIIGVEGGEMQGNVGLELARNPLRQGVKLFVGIVLARNEQRRDLGPDTRFVNEIFERIEHGLERAGAALGVKALGEAFKIDIRRVHAREQALAWLGANEASGDRDVLHAFCATGGRGIEGVFHEDDRIVVRVGDAGASQSLGRARDGLRPASALSRATSRLFEMSQFWQNEHARLQPAVPNDRTAEPGRK